MTATLFRFKGGVKPAAHKDESAGDPIQAATMPAHLIVPLRQTTSATLPLVSPGQHVMKGEKIGAAEGLYSAAVHAPTSGRVIAIESRPLPHPSRLSDRCVIIEPDGEERWIERRPVDFRSAPADVLRDRLRDAGVVGLGGAAFPSHVKMRLLGAGRCHTLVVNGAECEPWITCDDRLMRERAASIVRGAVIIRHVLGATRTLVGIEDNKAQAMVVMREAARAVGDDIEVVAVPTLYPAGGEKQLIRVLTGIEIPYGRLGPDFGVQCFNVGTAHAVCRALDHGEPIVSRVVTVTGNVEHPRNYEVLLGTPVAHLLWLAGERPDTDRRIMGGPMMGFALSDTSVPVVKATNCILAASDRLFPRPPPEMPCIRCGRCAGVCPQELQPHELYWFARAHNFGKCQEYHLFDCIECGCCSYVCPSSIRLVDYYRFAKSEIRAREADKAAADAARDRFEFRNERIERDKREKAERLAAKTAAARKAALAKLAAASRPEPTAAQPASTVPATAPAGPTAGESAAAGASPLPDEQKRALIEAAMERAQAQKARAQPRNTESLSPAQRTEIAEIEKRRARIREMARTPEPPPE
jgi:electron transport complex protein RnfC